jgi:hypothetical protein
MGRILQLLRAATGPQPKGGKMKTAFYFLGFCFLVWVSLLLGAVDDMKLVVAKAPVVFEEGRKIVGEGRRFVADGQKFVDEMKAATEAFSAQVDRARAAVPAVSVPSMPDMKAYIPETSLSGAWSRIYGAEARGVEPAKEPSK